MTTAARTVHRHCDVEGCGRIHEARGLCSPHYQRLKKWGEIRPEQPISRSLSRAGILNPKWNGGTSTMTSGRVMVYCPHHPNKKKNGIYIRRAHLIIESKIGRPVRTGEIVHHKNNDPSDDRLSNLQLMTVREHRQWHMKNGQAKRMRKTQLKHINDNKR